MNIVRRIAGALFSLCFLVVPAAAHEVPARATALIYIRPEGNTLQVLVRTSLEAMRDIEPPLRGAGYLTISASRSMIEEAARLWIADYLTAFENGRQLISPAISAVRISLPSDRSFTSYETARSHLAGPPLPDSIDLPWQQAMIDVALVYGIEAPGSSFSVDPMLAHLGVETTTIIRYKPPEAGERILRFTGNPGVVHLDPSWLQSMSQFIAFGFEHILDGIDHLLFVFCLVIPFRRVRSLIVIVTSFTVAHSITLAAAALGLVPAGLWFPPLIETLIALSIVVMALENIIGPRLERRWVIAFGFGLIHGFGFSFALSDSLQFDGSHLALSLVAFNLGVELGQVAVVLMAVPLLALLFRRVMPERAGTIILSALVAHTAWHWMLERGGELGSYSIQLPAWNTALALTAMRVAMLLLVVVGALWVVKSLARRLTTSSHTASAPADQLPRHI
ncbi:MAG: HupE/UreJ family protein [Gemmatimonadota bacterium]